MVQMSWHSKPAKSFLVPFHHRVCSHGHSSASGLARRGHPAGRNGASRCKDPIHPDQTGSVSSLALWSSKTPYWQLVQTPLVFTSQLTHTTRTDTSPTHLRSGLMYTIGSSPRRLQRTWHFRFNNGNFHDLYKKGGRVRMSQGDILQSWSMALEVACRNSLRAGP